MDELYLRKKHCDETFNRKEKNHVELLCFYKYFNVMIKKVTHLRFVHSFKKSRYIHFFKILVYSDFDTIMKASKFVDIGDLCRSLFISEDLRHFYSVFKNENLIFNFTKKILVFIKYRKTRILKIFLTLKK